MTEDRDKWRKYVHGVANPRIEQEQEQAKSSLYRYHCSFNHSGGMICHDVFFDCTADLVGQLNGNGEKGMLQIDAPPVENFWLRHWIRDAVLTCAQKPT